MRLEIFPDEIGQTGKIITLGRFCGRISFSAQVLAQVYRPQVIYHKEIAAKRVIYKKPKKPWPADFSKALAKMGIKSLYSHQAEAVDLIRQSDSIIIATPTASGKSLVYNLPVFEKIFQKSETKALYFFPLKALAQDQLKAVQELADRLPEEQRPTAAILDGDTSSYVYTHSRKMTELISVWTKPRLGEIQDKFSSYRAGFLPEERREIEGRSKADSQAGSF